MPRAKWSHQSIESFSGHFLCMHFLCCLTLSLQAKWTSVCGIYSRIYIPALALKYLFELVVWVLRWLKRGVICRKCLQHFCAQKQQVFVFSVAHYILALYIWWSVKCDCAGFSGCVLLAMYCDGVFLLLLWFEHTCRHGKEFNLFSANIYTKRYLCDTWSKWTIQQMCGNREQRTQMRDFKLVCSIDWDLI